MWNPWADSDARDELRNRLKWFLLGRVAIISGFFLVLASGYLSPGVQTYSVAVDRLLLIVGAIYAVTLVSALLVDRLEDLRAFTYVQIAIDLILITGAIYLTAGIDSPFAFLYSLAIVNGAVLLFTSGAVFAAIGATVLYDALLLGIATGLIAWVNPHGLGRGTVDAVLISRILTTNLTFFLIAFLSGFLTRRISETEQLLDEKRAETERIAMLKDTLALAIGSTLVTTDPDGLILAVDSSDGESIFRNQPAESLRGRDIGDVFPPLKLTPSARLRFLQSPSALEPVELSHSPEGGEPPIDLRCSTAPLRDTFGHPIGALYVLQDVTSLRTVDDDASEIEPAAAELITSDDSEEKVTERNDGLYGTSSAMQELRKLIERVAASDATVLISGESGTGKEVSARAIHSLGDRRDKPFVAINCGAIPENLIESELFGHAKGAFTGAIADRAGAFRLADSGTIFLDEIGELALHLQVKLLRVLQERVFRPVGSETSVAVNVRIIAATNRDLPKLVEEEKFREDLFYRLNVIHLEVPPLRQRSDDIPLLVRHFLDQFSEVHGRQVSHFTPEAARALLDHDYPGNVRELENVVEHAVALCDGDVAGVEHLPGYLTGESAPAAGAPIRPVEIPSPEGAEESWEDIDLERDLAEYEKNILLRALNEAGGVKKRAAELLGINYRSLRHRLQKYGLGDIGPGSTTVQ